MLCQDNDDIIDIAQMEYPPSARAQFSHQMTSGTLENSAAPNIDTFHEGLRNSEPQVSKIQPYVQDQLVLAG